LLGVWNLRIQNFAAVLMPISLNNEIFSKAKRAKNIFSFNGAEAG
jgi:hypothetical protein